MMNRAFNPEKNSQSEHLAQPATLCYVAPRANHVLAVTSKNGNVDFIVGFCRSAVLRRGEIHCLDGFRRVSDPAMGNSWAHPLEFAPEPPDRRGIYPVQMADWMTRPRNTGKQL